MYARNVYKNVKWQYEKIKDIPSVLNQVTVGLGRPFALQVSVTESPLSASTSFGIVLQDGGTIVIN